MPVVVVALLTFVEDDRIFDGASPRCIDAVASSIAAVWVGLPCVFLARGGHRRAGVSAPRCDASLSLLVGALGFLVVIVVPALSSDCVLALVMGALARAFSGLLWGMLAGYARRITTATPAGRALSIASLGTPSGSWLGATFDRRWPFGTLTRLMAVILVLAAVLVLDAPVSGPRPICRSARSPPRRRTHPGRDPRPDAPLDAAGQHRAVSRRRRHLGGTPAVARRGRECPDLLPAGADDQPRRRHRPLSLFAARPSAATRRRPRSPPTPTPLEAQPGYDG